MTQKSMAQQLAEMKNNLIAMEKLLRPEAPEVVPEKKAMCFLVTYDDGTTQKFVKEPAGRSTEEILAQLRSRAEKMKYETATDPAPRKSIGFACIFNGVRYNSIRHAGRSTGICIHKIKSNLDKGINGWIYA